MTYSAGLACLYILSAIHRFPNSTPSRKASYMMVFRKSAPALMAFVIVLTVLSFDPAIAETDWYTIKAKVFKACHNMIKQGPGSSDEPTLRCCQSFIREDVDGICEHLNDLDDQTVLKKLVKAIRDCDKSFKSTTKHCASTMNEFVSFTRHICYCDVQLFDSSVLMLCSLQNSFRRCKQ